MTYTDLCFPIEEFKKELEWREDLIKTYSEYLFEINNRIEDFCFRLQKDIIGYNTNLSAEVEYNSDEYKELAQAYYDKQYDKLAELNEEKKFLYNCFDDNSIIAIALKFYIDNHETEFKNV